MFAVKDVARLGRADWNINKLLLLHLVSWSSTLFMSTMHGQTNIKFLLGFENRLFHFPKFDTKKERKKKTRNVSDVQNEDARNEVPPTVGRIYPSIHWVTTDFFPGVTRTSSVVAPKH